MISYHDLSQTIRLLKFRAVTLKKLRRILSGRTIHVLAYLLSRQRTGFKLKSLETEAASSTTATSTVASATAQDSAFYC